MGRTGERTWFRARADLDAAAYDRALELTANRAERSFLEARRAEVRGRAGRTGPTGPTG